MSRVDLSPDTQNDATSDARSDSTDMLSETLIDEFALGYRFSCVRVGGDVKCWGAGSFGVRDVPENVQGRATSIVAGYGMVCATRDDESRVCWGDDAQGIITPPSGVSDVVVGREHACGITPEGEVSCWGAQQIPPVLGIASNPVVNANIVATGDEMACAVTDNETRVFCWGRNDNGQLGLGMATGLITPVEVGIPVSPISALAVGDLHSCAVADGDVYCWGENGNLHIPWDQTYLATPTPMPPTATFVDVKIASQTTCALTDGNEVFCWGRNDVGEVGTGEAGSQGVTKIDLEGATALFGGPVSFCTLSQSGEAMCWGSNAYGETNPRRTTLRDVPAEQTAASDGVASVTLGANHACAIDPDNVVYCWGRNDENPASGIAPIAISAAPMFENGFVPEAIDASNNHTCAVGERSGAQELYCWGLNNLDQGAGPNQNTIQPFVRPSRDWSTVSAGEINSCGLTKEGRLFCWGWNEDGALGSTNPDASEFEVTGLGTIAKVEVSQLGATCALVGTSILCWGNNTYGQAMRAIGDTTLGLPVQPSGNARDARDFCMGATFGCQITNQNTVSCWGSNIFGEGARSTGQPAPDPVPVLKSNGLPLDEIRTISCGSFHVCARDDADITWCWGDNSEGQIGSMIRKEASADRTERNFATQPTPVSTTADELFLGRGYSCGLSGTVLSCWGNSPFNQFGDGTIGTLKPLPLQASDIP